MSFIGDALGAKNDFNALDPSIISHQNLAADYDRTKHQSQESLANQQAFVGQLGAQNGLGNQASVFGQQQGLANQLQMQAMGQGPNPAQAALAQATQANTANQAALMAGQRGTQANAGLIARQASMQGGANQQQMAGQSATMQAQQQLAAQQALMQQQQSMQGVAGQQIGNQMQGLQGIGQMALGMQQGATANIGQDMSGTAAQNQINAQTAAGNQAGKNALTGAVIGAGAAAMTGGMGGGGMAAAGSQNTNLAGKLSYTPGGRGDYSTLAHGGMVGGPSSMVGQHMHRMSSGGNVPGQASQPGNNYSNDTVPAMLSPGEVVIPRSVMESKNPSEAAARFVEACLAKRSK